jgi:hypothetical protein
VATTTAAKPSNICGARANKLHSMASMKKPWSNTTARWSCGKLRRCRAYAQEEALDRSGFQRGLMFGTIMLKSPGINISLIGSPPVHISTPGTLPKDVRSWIRRSLEWQPAVPGCTRRTFIA